MVSLVLATLALTPVAAWLGRQRPWAASALAVWPATLTAYFAWALAATLGGHEITDALAWVPSLGLTLSFRLDGLSGLFALLIAGVGTGIVVYGAHYFAGHPHAGRFQATLFLFMAAMLGVVLTDNLLTMFVFWELTGFASYLLIGFEHERGEARRAAVQALIVTGMGGLGLLAAALLLLQVAGTASVPGLVPQSSTITSHPYAAPITLLVLLAAFTKSAQFPFHFWLPGAMAAPTPVSAYLHSATMVKAGIYLVARMTPVLGDTTLWLMLVAGAGALTMIGGSWRAVVETDLKRILAYSTVGALGTIMLLLGLGTPATLTAALLYLVAHACYKGTLFLVAGTIDHEAGTREVTALGGLRRLMPVTALAGALAAASMAGLPLLLGFVAKESAYEAVLHQPVAPVLLMALLVLASALLGAAGLLAGWGPFAGARPGATESDVHEAGPGLWMAPLVLASLGVVAGVAPALLASPLSLAATNVAGAPITVSPSLWHGLTLPLLLSGVTVAGTLLVYTNRALVRQYLWPRALGTARLFDAALGLADAVSRRLAPAMQSASLASYVLAFVVTGGVLAAFGLLVGEATPLRTSLVGVRVHEALVALLIIAGACSAVIARTTMTAVLSLGTAGYGIALMFLMFGAPDLAMTQFAVETLTAVIFVFVFWQFPRLELASSWPTRLRDGLVSLAFGGLIMWIALRTASMPTSQHISEYYAATAPLEAHGRNIVNVILVDFRSLDTLGEITVLVTAAIGVRALLQIAAAARRER